MLREYAEKGCPVSVGRDWTLDELSAAAERGPHRSALEPDAIAQIQVEAREKEAQGFCKLYDWEELKRDLPKKLKLSPLAMIPHKSRKYRAILDLSFELRLAGYTLPSVNDATKHMAPAESMDQIGTVLGCPRGRANQHPAAPLLREYAAKLPCLRRSRLDIGGTGSSSR